MITFSQWHWINIIMGLRLNNWQKLGYRTESRYKIILSIFIYNKSVGGGGRRGGRKYKW